MFSAIISGWVEAAETANITITHVLETHMHNDYVTGGYQLAKKLKAAYVGSLMHVVQGQKTPVWLNPPLKELIVEHGRVVGAIVVKDGMITIYNKEHPDGFSPDKGSGWENTMQENSKQSNLMLS